MRHRAAAALGALLLSAGASTTAAASEREIVTLSASRSTPTVLTGGARPATLRIPFELPAGARQGPDAWYLVRLRYRLRFARDSGPGFAWVTSDTGGRTSAQIEYTTARPGGRLSVRRTTVDLTHGQRERRSRSVRDALTFTNYLQYEGVRPGPNMWTIRLEQSGKARVERLELLGDSAILRTDVTPFPLALTASAVGARPQVGERFTIRATLAARAGQPVRGIVVRASPPPDGGATLAGPATRRIARLGGGARSVSFSFVARRPGPHSITLVADSDANVPNASVRVEVLHATRAGGAPATLWALAAMPALAMAGWVAASRRRRRLSG